MLLGVSGVEIDNAGLMLGCFTTPVDPTNKTNIRLKMDLFEKWSREHTFHYWCLLVVYEFSSNYYLSPCWLIVQVHTRLAVM